MRVVNESVLLGHSRGPQHSIFHNASAHGTVSDGALLWETIRDAPVAMGASWSTLFKAALMATGLARPAALVDVRCDKATRTFDCKEAALEDLV